jgi:L-fuculose-phosphate aldolase
LTNAAGSNFSARASKDALYLTATGNAKRNRLKMTADELLLVDFHGKIIEGKGDLSVSWPTHLRMYQEFESVGAVIHAHPRYATAFACQSESMPPFLDAMNKYGSIPILPRHLKVDSDDFGQAIVEVFRQAGTSFEKYGHAVFYPFHGVLVAAPSLDDAFDLLERIEYNATALLSSSLFTLATPGVLYATKS